MSTRNRLTARIAFDKAVPVQKLEQALPSARRLRREKERREAKNEVRVRILPEAH